VRPFVLIQDYQNAEVDALSLRSLSAEVTAINGNCACCDAWDELIGSLQAISPEPKRLVLVEANGTTDPFALLERMAVLSFLIKSFSSAIGAGLLQLNRVLGHFW